MLLEKTDTIAQSTVKKMVFNKLTGNKNQPDFILLGTKAIVLEDNDIIMVMNNGNKVKISVELI